MIRCLNLKCVSTSCFVLLLGSSVALAQFSDIPSTAVKGGSVEEYLFPISPGVINTLAGTMGELRNTHFHSGLDIRTNNVIGAAVVAARSGYISRVVKSSYSYGNVIFVTHPDSNTTLYAHLDQFRGKLAEHVRSEQYGKKSFEIDLRFQPGEFPVNQGDTLALSGNTGSSNGPHLHFDIRDKDMNALNPLKFGFEEIADKTKPVVRKIALRTMDINSRINGRFGRFEFSVLKVGADYVLQVPILASGKIGVEVLAYDKMDNSRFQCGINMIEMAADSQTVFKQFIDKIEMPVTRGILSLFNYSTFKASQYRFNKLYVEDGNPLNFYNGSVNHGIISIGEGMVPVQIKLTDTYFNQTQVSFKLKYDVTTVKVPTLPPPSKPLSYSVAENILQITSKSCKDTTAALFANGKKWDIDQTYIGPYSKVFLHDLRKSIPDSIQVCGETARLNIVDTVPSGTEYTYYNNFSTIYFPDSALFDTLYFSVGRKLQNNLERISIGDKWTPLMRDVRIEWLPENKYDSQKYSVYRVDDNGGLNNLGCKWRDGRVVFQIREFGEFAILKDSIAPSILLIACNQTRARFKILDDLSGIFSFEASINGEWLLMNYDYKTGILYSEKLDKKVPLKGDFELKVRDYAGNEKSYKQKIL